MSGTENAVARRGGQRTRSRGDSQPICARQATGGDVKIRFDKVGYPLYCDAGPHEGDMRIDLTIRLYLSPEEYARYEGSDSLQITLQENGDGRPGTGNTAELSAGDVVAAGDVLLAAGRPAGWEPVTGPLTEVRTSEHGRSPPARSRADEPADGHRCGWPQAVRDANHGRRSPVPGRSVLRFLAVRTRFPRPVRKQEPQADGDFPDAGAGQAAASACQRLRAVPAPERRGLVGLRGRGRAADR